MKAFWGSGGLAPRNLTSVLHGGEWSASRPGHFSPRVRAPGTHCIGGWVDPEPVSTRWWEEKFLAPTGTRIPDHPSRSPALYHWAIPAPIGRNTNSSQIFIYFLPPSHPTFFVTSLSHPAAGSTCKHVTAFLSLSLFSVSFNDAFSTVSPI
jgi:hypothetical protein